ncbi:hypothetical protein GOP47_0006244 [Adiantum capillus-veneris]|uniref:ACT domain-containing protein n=1 Tax=Adiantum capillus-veneris TaxID=13818 RepID=A0A9D4V3H0_ADICA|nr:hypothetical protein GOP47_0006244 [Adiantum capillus-veneris]
MGLPSDEIVLIRLGQKKGDPSIITVNCPDKLGLGSDLTRLLFEFGLTVVRGDMSTDGKWCFALFWVLPADGSSKNIRWAALKKLLVAACPSTRPHLLLPHLAVSKPKKMYLLQTSSMDSIGLLNDISRTLWELEITVHKMNATVTPDGKALNMFCVTDSREMLHEKRRQDDLCFRLKSTLGEEDNSCDVVLAGSEWGGLDCTPFLSVPSTLAMDLCSKKAPGTGKVTIKLDNSLSPGHTLLQIWCKDRRGLMYDCMRTLKDFQIQVAYGRLATDAKGDGEIDLFILHGDGKKIVDPVKQQNLCSRLELEITQPVKIMIMDRGPDIELLVAASIGICGQGRPRVLHDITRVLKTLGICIFKADFGWYLIENRQWEVYRFLFMDKPDLDLSSSHMKAHIAEQIRSMLVG